MPGHYEQKTNTAKDREGGTVASTRITCGLEEGSTEVLVITLSCIGVRLGEREWEWEYMSDEDECGGCIQPTK